MADAKRALKEERDVSAKARTARKTFADAATAIGKGVHHAGETIDSRIGRGSRTLVSRWFWELDRVLLSLIVALIALGLLAVAAASPAAAQRLSTDAVQIDPYFFVWRQMMWLVLVIPTMMFISMLPPELARRTAVVGCAVVIVTLALLPFIGSEVNGARRWISFGFINLQPSEFLKPFFAVTLAWLFAVKVRQPRVPVLPFAFALTAVIIGLLMIQPDLGQTIIILAILGVMLLVSGIGLRWLIGAAAAGIGFLTLAYFTYGNARARIDGWLMGGEANDQIGLAHRTLTAGGLTGVGQGMGERKFSLPEGHTDYIFSVIGEEYGLLVCALVACLFFVIVMRVLVRLLEERDPFLIFATAGLITQFGGQAVINMMVNLRLFPAKGMTLPFISYGGSSLLALSITVGLLLAFTRRNPWLDRSPYAMTGRKA